MMTLKEALATGRRIKRRKWDHLLSAETWLLSMADALADDWEVEPPRKVKKTIWVGVCSAWRGKGFTTSFGYFNKEENVSKAWDLGVHPIEIEVEE